MLPRDAHKAAEPSIHCSCCSADKNQTLNVLGCNPSLCPSSRIKLTLCRRSSKQGLPIVKPILERNPVLNMSGSPSIVDKSVPGIENKAPPAGCQGLELLRRLGGEPCAESGFAGPSAHDRGCLHSTHQPGVQDPPTYSTPVMKHKSAYWGPSLFEGFLGTLALT
jgi:hypothetical protein